MLASPQHARRWNWRGAEDEAHELRREHRGRIKSRVRRVREAVQVRMALNRSLQLSWRIGPTRDSMPFTSDTQRGSFVALGCL
jgi:hypothetical protein